MSQYLPGQNYPLRISVTVLLLLGGFFFPLLFLPCALVAWSLVDDLRNPTKPEDHPFFNPKLVAASDPSWPERWLALCESPAETGFLKAVMEAYGLSPSSGKLVGNGLSFDMQVKLPPYRVDFLANDRLVVEVDGAAYHSSPEDVARDEARDETLRSRGYSILRIPARVVFNTPNEAVDRLRTALAGLLPRSEPAVTHTISEHIANSLEEAKAWSRAAVSIKTDGFSSEIEQRVMMEAAVQESARKRDLAAKLANDPVLAKFYSEAIARMGTVQPPHTVRAVRLAEQAAMDSALRTKLLEEKLDANPELRRVFEKILPKVEAAVRNGELASARSELMPDAPKPTQTKNDAEPSAAGALPKTMINLGRLDANAKFPPGKITSITLSGSKMFPTPVTIRPRDE